MRIIWNDNKRWIYLFWYYISSTNHRKDSEKIQCWILFIFYSSESYQDQSNSVDFIHSSNIIFHFFISSDLHQNHLHFHFNVTTDKLIGKQILEAEFHLFKLKPRHKLINKLVSKKFKTQLLEVSFC